MLLLIWNLNARISRAKDHLRAAAGINGHEKQESSWLTTQDKSKGRRFDQIFLSKELNPSKCMYIHEVRDQRLSDHSSMLAEFDI